MTTPLPSAAATAAAARSGTTPAVAAVEHSLAAIAAEDGRLKAFVEVDAESALQAAAQIDALPAADRAALPLAGVPLGVKGDVGPENPVLTRLIAAGAIPVGRTAAPELCVWGTTDSSPHGITRNPWDPSRTPGGSSGGSAAAVAAGMVPLALGGDGMGSLRLPAACCGLVTIKPGSGTVPTSLGLDNWGGLAESGPLATTVADAALALSVMAARPELAELGATRGIRVGVSSASPIRYLGLDVVKVQPAWRRAVRDSAIALRDFGLEVVDTSIPVPEDPWLLLARWTSAVERDAAAANLPLSAMERRNRHHALLGRTLFRHGGAGDGDTRWNRAAGRLRESVERAMDSAGVEVYLTPTLADFPLEATRWHERSWGRSLTANLRFAPFGPQWNVLGWPAMSVPAGLAAGPGGPELPTAVQLVGRPGSEATLLAVAAALEAARPWPRTAPAAEPPNPLRVPRSAS